ncbi:MAG: hypothetical protein U0893_06070 [Chloroflexota bacterium]
MCDGSARDAACARGSADTRAADLALLRRFEPIVRYTQGEDLLPTDVDWYVQQSSLWVSHPDGHRQLLFEEGELDLDRLGEERAVERGAIVHLTFSDPLNLAQLSAFLLEEGVRQIRDPGTRFRASVARLARVGYLSRLLDAVFSLTLFLRGRVPGDSAAAAILACRRRPPEERVTPYYGRVVRENGWVVLQYWVFYAFNNWRSGFFGANDHEADWEMISIYLAERPDGEIAPAWVAYASHDFHGDDLRRAWDDAEELERVGDHPVVYAGAGSHAAYFRPGEYVAEIEVPYLHRFARPIRRLASFGLQALRQAGLLDAVPQVELFRIPFVDYARGDGPAIGPGEPRGWSPVLLDPVPAWVSRFRGLWGYFARDPAAGENAPSGPMYNRDGTVRLAWYDPIGWAGLDDVAPPGRESAVVERSIADLRARQAHLEVTIASGAAELESLGAEIAAIRGQHHLQARLATLETRIEAARSEAYDQRREHAQNQLMLETLEARRGRLAARDPAAVTLPEERRAHIRRLARPAQDADLRLRALLEVWAATSIGLLLVGMVVLAVAAPQHLIDGALALVASLVIVEAVFRRRLARLVSTVSVGLALVSVGVLVYHLFYELTIAWILAAGLFVLWENLRELRR